jgi:flagellar basal-body rod modification protein FlgD
MSSKVLGVGSSASDLQMNYLNLLVTQLKNQDPLNPTDNAQMTAQLTQLSELQQLQDMNASFAKVLYATQLGQSSGFIGKTVTYTPKDQTTPVSAKVTGVTVNGGAVQIWAGNQAVDLDAIQSIQD